jgi:hypothetical protein
MLASFILGVAMVSAGVLKQAIIAGHTLDIVREAEVSMRMDEITQMYDGIFTAHNDKAGALFHELALGDSVSIYEEEYVVTEILEYQALPDGVYVDMQTRERLSTYELVQRVYEGRTTLQTCIARGSDKAWGRLFLILEEDDDN